MITVIDYGMGNLSSVTNAVKRFNADVLISGRPEDVKKTDKLILPGVGAFKDAYEGLEQRRLIEPIVDFIKSGKPFLGLCLGLQLLFTTSYEDGQHKGFGIIRGAVKPFPKGSGFKIPHMGWNSIQIKQSNCPLMKGISDLTYMYFVHSYYVEPEDSNVVAGTTAYGLEFCSVLCKDNIYAMQCHPEKSQGAGLKVIENFIGL